MKTLMIAFLIALSVFGAVNATAAYACDCNPCTCAQGQCGCSQCRR